MGKNLRDLLLQMKFSMTAKDINNYFATDFYRDFKVKGKVLNFLNEEFYSIDVDYYDSPDFEERVLKTIDKAIEMLV